MTDHRDFVLHKDTGGPTLNIKTDELHAFMGDIDWEGTDDGITIWLHVKPGDTIRLHEDGAVRVIPAAKEKK
jgi:hypothetical protein